MREPIGIINISDTPDPERNADWIKTEENRQSEREIHERLAEEHAEEQ